MVQQCICGVDVDLLSSFPFLVHQVNMTADRISKINLVQFNLPAPLAAAFHAPARGTPWADLWAAFMQTPEGRASIGGQDLF